MYHVKIVELKKQSEGCWAVKKTRAVSCQEYEKEWEEAKDKQAPCDRPLLLKFYTNGKCFKSQYFNKREPHYNIFIENNEGKTLCIINYPLDT